MEVVRFSHHDPGKFICIGLNYTDHAAVRLEVTGLGVLENPIKDAEPRQGPRELPRLCAPR